MITIVNIVMAIAQLVRNGKNSLSAYQETLSLEDIEAVSAYVLTQAEHHGRQQKDG